jgi:hypothetical protein
MLKVTVTDQEGKVLSQLIKSCNSKNETAVRAAHTRYTNQAMKKFYGVWHRIEVEPTGEQA